MGLLDNTLGRLWRSGDTPPQKALLKWAPIPVPTGRDDRLRSPTSGRIVQFDPRRLREAGYVPEAGLELEFAEHYRTVKRPVIRRALAAQAEAAQRLILVTSSLPGDGKTFTTVNLALSMARERDMSVLLVDADFPKAHISRALGVNDQPGLLDAVEGVSANVESLIMHSNVKGLDFLPGGQFFDGAAELVASSRMTEVMTQLVASNPRRLVLFDSSPLLVSSEARALVQIPGQVLLIARVGRTPRPALQDAIALIDKKKLHGLILNDSYVTPKNNYYGYAHYYREPQKGTDGK